MTGLVIVRNISQLLTINVQQHLPVQKYYAFSLYYRWLGPTNTKKVFEEYKK